MSLTVRSGNDLSNLFSGLNNNASANNLGGVSGLSGLLSEYNAIKSGSYAKLAKQYYSKDTTSKKTNPLNKDFEDYDGNVKEKSTKLVKDEEIKANKSLIADVSSLRKDISSLSNDDTLFAKEAKKDSDGREATGYNLEKISSKLSSFVKNYNSVIESGVESDSQTVLRNVLGMTNATSSYKNQLETAGIKINSDNTLSFDKDALKTTLESDNGKNSSLNTVAGLFGKNSNYLKQIDTMSTNVASQAASDVYSLGGYNSTGQYKQTLESIYNTVI